ncbi:hypothetical protein AMATHDRAFT_4100 [Amanita thiersii Skay4041]|uniref:DEK C-terminal domain-containing protein n=1 Tax=Amanita thiersii Skay4041 TaxID=703135 RepID=A0A2A9NLT4_9AGAR|nr:hypothetical protein AMATHDRAFT_4100 [Amanita thiersii Skay4041]
MESIPPIHELVDLARTIVLAAGNKGELGNLTQRTVRQEVEKRLSLEPGSLEKKEYKSSLKTAVAEAVEEAKNRANSPEPRDKTSEINVSPPKPSSSKSKAKQISPKASRPKKRKEPDGVVSPLPQKHVQSDEEDLKQVGLSKPQSKLQKKRITSPESEPEVEEKPKSSGKPSSSSKPKQQENDGNESELSVLIDEPPKKKKRAPKSREKSELKPKKGKGKEPEVLNKDEATIKRLKSLVLACGVRKVWSKVFKDTEDSRQRIRILKEILSDLGMTGRYSFEQAREIKEKRALAQELAEDVQSFERAVVGKGEKRGSTHSESEDPDAAMEDVKPIRKVLYPSDMNEFNLIWHLVSTSSRQMPARV